MELSPKFSELGRLYSIELMLISQVMPFMFIVAKATVAPHKLKRQCVLVPTDLKKNLDHFIKVMKWRVLDFSCFKTLIDLQEYDCKQQIDPALVNAALQKLTKIGPVYSNITIDIEWEDFSEESDAVLWQTRIPGSLITVTG